MGVVAAKAETMTFLKALICPNTKYAKKKETHALVQMYFLKE